MVTGKQIRAARGLLGWSATTLAEKCQVTRETINRIEDATVTPREGTLADIVHVFDDNNVQFIDNRGVAFKEDDIVILEGKNVFFRLLDDVISSLEHTEHPEALFSCVCDRVSPVDVVENYRRLRQAGIAMRSLVEEGDTYLMGKIDEYRYVPSAFFHNNASIIYGDKFATMVLDPQTQADASAVIIRNRHMALAQRNLFNLLWSITRQPSLSTATDFYD